MLQGLIVIADTSLSNDFDMIKQFCDKNDVQIYRSDRLTCVVLAKPKKMYKLMKFVARRDRRVINIELAD